MLNYQRVMENMRWCSSVLALQELAQWSGPYCMEAGGMAKKSGFANMGVVKKTRCVMIHFEGINIQHPA